MLKFVIHDFYCMNCGRPLSLPRKIGQQREKYHKKKLYCPYCKQTVNHIEVKNHSEKLCFEEKFAAGTWKAEVYKNET